MSLSETRPYNAGVQAFLDGLTKEDCPYEPGFNRRVWMYGFSTANFADLSPGENLIEKLQEMADQQHEENDDDE